MTKLFNENPPAESARLLDFTDAEILSGIVNDTFFLTVSGKKPYINMDVKLFPLIYIQQPDYWEIEVVGILPPIGLPATGDYTVSIALDSIRGKKGIEVVGATGRKRLEVPPNN